MGSMPVPAPKPEEVSFKSQLSQEQCKTQTQEEFVYWQHHWSDLEDEAHKTPQVVVHALKNFTESPETGALLDAIPRKEKIPEGSTVGIVGAGMAGLYIAMILEALDIPGLKYEILEGSDRVGGRVYTKYFEPEEGKPKSKHDYYDVGAMRFPEIPIMEKTFALFNYLKDDVVQIPYIMESTEERGYPGQPSRYNDRTIMGKPKAKEDDSVAQESAYKDAKYDVYEVSELFGGRILKEFIKNPYKYVDEMFEPFKQRLRDDWKKGYKALMKYDEYSVRGFMMSHGITPLDDYYSIQWLETLTDGSGLYDQSFSEGVIDSMDFDYYSETVKPDTQKAKWWCIEQGTQKVPDAMRKALKQPLKDDDLRKRVTKIWLNKGTDGKESSIKVSYLKPGVHTEGSNEPVKPITTTADYVTVFATPSLACMQRIDLIGLDLLYEQKDAMRSLHYDTATKVGMRFTEPWWIKLGIRGGLGKCDMSIRTCVYPSYNLDDSEVEPAVLLCSYSWAQDAARMGSLIKGDWKKETELKEIIIDNLTWLHIEHYKRYNGSPNMPDEEAYEKLHTWIDNTYDQHHAWNWHDYEFTSGAYGKFGPGQFSGCYTALSCPTADSRFHFVGEAVSEHHGWIVGALDSAHQAVLEFLRRFGLTEYIDKLNNLPFIGPVPKGIDEQTSIMRVLLGRLRAKQRLNARNAVEQRKSDPLGTVNKIKSRA